MPVSIRYLFTIVLLAAVGAFLQMHLREKLPQREPLASLTTEMGRWQGVDESISPEVLRTLGNGDFLQRAYFDRSNSDPVQLFIAYFPTQRSGETVHSPQNCLPGSGWSPLQSGQIVVHKQGYRDFPANRYLIGKGEDRQIVLYWYLSHGRGEASEYRAKLNLVEDAIRFNRSDGALIRLSAVLHREESPDRAQARLVEFAQQLVPELGRFIPN